MHILLPQAVHPDGSCIFTGGRRGAMHRWSLPDSSASPAVAADGGASGSNNTSNGGNGREGPAPEDGIGDRIGRGRTPPNLRHACEPLHLRGSGHSDTIDRMVSCVAGD